MTTSITRSLILHCRGGLVAVVLMMTITTLFSTGRRSIFIAAFTTTTSTTTCMTTVTTTVPMSTARRTVTAASSRLWSSASGDGSFKDESGRRIRVSTTARQPPPGKRIDNNRSPGSGWGDDLDFSSNSKNYDNDDNDDNDWGQPRRSRVKETSSWDDFNPWQGGKNNDRDNDWGALSRRPRQPPRQQQQRRGDGGERDRRGDFSDRRPASRNNNNNNRYDRNSPKKIFRKDGKDASSRSINMNSLEGAGFVHLYGLSSVLNALTANRRDFKTSVEKSITTDHDVDARFRRDFDPDFSDDDDYDDIDHAQAKTQDTTVAVKPQAQFRPYLFVQEGREKSGRRGSKASTAQRVLQLAEERNIPIAYVDKGILNTLSSNRPHQGFVLRCGKLYFEGMSRIPMPSGENESPSLWLVLDEVVDPQNLGALLRSAYFLGGGNTPSVHSRVGILVCSKNSAPPSPVVSAASAGALELLEVYSTTNLPRTLNQAREDGFRIIGASSSVPSNVAGGSQNNKRQNEEGGVEDWAPPLYDLQDLPAQGAEGDDRPILMVLGSEGHGLRTLVAKACTEFVRIPSGLGTSSVSDEGLDSDHENDDDDYDDDSNGEPGVDSLNVSVTGGIMLWHLLYGGAR